MLLENGGYLAVLNGHQATSTTINSGGMLSIFGAVPLTLLRRAVGNFYRHFSHSEWDQH
nr:AIDA repeat-containing protein [Escherichia coli]